MAWPQAAGQAAIPIRAELLPIERVDEVLRPPQACAVASMLLNGWIQIRCAIAKVDREFPHHNRLSESSTGCTAVSLLPSTSAPVPPCRRMWGHRYRQAECSGPVWQCFPVEFSQRTQRDSIN